MNKAKWRFTAWIAMWLLALGVRAQAPQLGAQIWIEPGQTASELDGWFRQLSESGMPVVRIFVLWAYVEPQPGRWDFSLYDAAFTAAARHHVRVVATLTPTGPPTFAGGDGNQGVGVMASEDRRAAAASYIARVVQRYRTHPALDTWLILNEPGQLPVETPSIDLMFGRWLAQRYSTVGAMNAAWGKNFNSFEAVTAPTTAKSWNRNAELDWRTFWEGHLTEELHWIANQVRLNDASHPLHTNPAGLTNNLAMRSDDLPAWRPFLDTLGCSIHPAWHFSLVKPEHYELLVSFTNDLVRGSIEPKPYWVTELQGGNNIYSGSQPMEPTASETAQWLWTSIGAGAKRVIFWLLNARRAGVEAGEWSLLDFQQHPGRDMVTAARIAGVIRSRDDLFAAAKPVEPPVTVILSLETMTFEEVYHRNDDPARDTDAQFFEALGFYRALSMLGIPPRLKYFDDYDWDARTPQPRVAILPDARVLTKEQTAKLKSFVEAGNTLLISGLSGFYGTHAEALPLAGFPLGAVTGGDLKEMHLPSQSLFIQLPQGALPSRMWQGSILPRTSEPIARDGDEITATEQRTGPKGRVLWIPSPVGMGAWFTEAAPLAKYLRDSVLSETPSKFSLHGENSACLLRVLQSGARYVTVLANGSPAPETCSLQAASAGPASALWGPQSAKRDDGYDVMLPPHGTSVTEWREL